MKTCLGFGMAALLLLSVLLNAPAWGALDDFDPYLYIDPATNKQLPYRLYVPDDYDPSQSYGLIVYLHSAGILGNTNTWQINSDVDSILIHARMPQYASFIMAPHSASWWSGDQTRMVNNIVDELCQAYPGIDPHKLFVTGVSMGGYGTFDMANRWPHKYSAAIPVSGGGEVSMAQNLRDQRLWAFHAADDGIVVATQTSRVINAIKALGGNPIYYEYPTGGHGISGRAYYQTPELYEWMFFKKRPYPDHYVEPMPKMNYKRTDLGNGLFGYTLYFYQVERKFQNTPYLLELAVEGLDGQIYQKKAFGLIDVHTQTQANQLNGLGSPSYLKEQDSWVISPFDVNTFAGNSPLDGTPVNGFREGENLYAMCVFSGSASAYEGAAVAYVVCDGQLRWTGSLQRNDSSRIAFFGQTGLGDYSGDGRVDQADYCLWADNYGWIGQPGENPADGNNDGKVDLADYTFWADHFGEGCQ